MRPAKFTGLGPAPVQKPCVLRACSEPPCLRREAEFRVQGGLTAQGLASFPEIWEGHCYQSEVICGGCLGCFGVGANATKSIAGPPIFCVLSFLGVAGPCDFLFDVLMPVFTFPTPLPWLLSTSCPGFIPGSGRV